MSMFEEQEGPDRPRPPKKRRPLGPGMAHPVDRLRMVALGAATAAGIYDPESEEQLFEGIVWIGDFSGWEVGIMRHSSGGQAVCLYHRCGWAEPLRPEGIASDHSVFLGNLVTRALEVAETHTCAPYEPSEEHKARVARWEAARRQADEARTARMRGMTRNSGAPIFPDPDEGLGRSERVSGPPAPLLYADAPGLTTPQHQQDGTPAIHVNRCTHERGCD